jgi:transaldolase / glucose-6-phosphate isomerase
MEENRVENRLAAVYQLGQSIWYDNIRRSLITSGGLEQLIDQDSVVGVTSNPTIFEHAIDGSDDYDQIIRDLVIGGQTEPSMIFEELSVSDIQMAADVLHPIYVRSQQLDGYVSLEVSPGAANDTQKTIAEARHLFHKVDRPNVMIKIPATAEGLPAIEQMIYEGVNINVTLIFAIPVYAQVAEAFIRGLEHRHKEGLPLSGIASVASFFVSRVDTLTDKLLQEKIKLSNDEAETAHLKSLLGTAAIANARLAYDHYKQIFHGDRFAILHALGAAPQRCLWASTSTKNPEYRDVLYVEELIGPETVDTMPPQTIQAFQDHGDARRRLDAADISAAQETMDQLEAAGIDMAAVTKQLELEGVKSFFDSYTSLMEATRVKIEKLQASELAHNGQATAAAPETETTTPAAADPGAPGESASLGALGPTVDTALAWAAEEQVSSRIWEKDPSLWKPEGADQSEIVDRLGWLTVTDQMRESLPRLEKLRDDVRASGFTHVVLLGMGGSSLAPEVLRETFGSAAGSPALIVLDSTDPATILAVDKAIDLPYTLFIVASKSGGTIETLSQFKFFYAQVQGVSGDAAGSQFIAITDPGTSLARLAVDMKFRDTFLNPPDIGGRYSALSFFGLVPAAILGVDIGLLLDRADAMRGKCRPEVPASENPGLRLGTILGTLARSGHDKVTLVLSPPVSTFGYWVEQLIAESTGKEGKGILPVEGESLGLPEDYGDDRLFVYLRVGEGADPAQDAALAALEAAGQPIVTLQIEDRYDLGGEFFRWEFATAVAGAFLLINAFNQPNVQEAKDKTNQVLAAYIQTNAILSPQAILRTQRVSIVVSDEKAYQLRNAVSLQAAVEAYLRQVSPGDYIAMLAYIQVTPETEELLQHIRLRMRNLCRVATTLGYGPRFQHSTGQLHKGGANNGVFIQLVAQDHEDVPIPDAPYTFSVLKAAQALGDLQTLEEHERRVIRVQLGPRIADGLGELRQAVDAAQLT